MSGLDDAFNPPSPEQDEEAERKRLEKLELRKQMLITLLQNKPFCEWMMEKLIDFQTFSMPFGNSAAGFPDPHATFFALGMKAAGWALWEEFDNVAPDLASRMRRGTPKT